MLRGRKRRLVLYALQVALAPYLLSIRGKYTAQFIMMYLYCNIFLKKSSQDLLQEKKLPFCLIDRRTLRRSFVLQLQNRRQCALRAQLWQALRVVKQPPIDGFAREWATKLVLDCSCNFAGCLFCIFVRATDRHCSVPYSTVLCSTSRDLLTNNGLLRRTVQYCTVLHREYIGII